VLPESDGHRADRHPVERVTRGIVLLRRLQPPVSFATCGHSRSHGAHAARARIFPNRFQTATGEGGAVRYFANLAIGSLTRPCHVHPDFKVFVVYPWSLIVSSPPAFLDRFTKYMLSMLEFLTKRHEAAIFSRDDKSGVCHSIFSILRDGLRAFVNKMHRSSFFGLVADETVPSLVLSLLGVRLAEPAPMAERIVELRVPLLPSPFHPPKGPQGGASGAEAGTPVEWLDPPGATTTHLAEYVRQANFHLMQLMRPESVYLHRAELPREYLCEYIERQEHFSLARFVASIVRTYLCVPAPLAAVAAGEAAAVGAAERAAVPAPSLAPADAAQGARPVTPPRPPPPPLRGRAVRVAEWKRTAAALQKWVVFTRSSGELKRLYTDWGLLAPLFAPLLAHSPDGLDANAEGFVRHWAAVCNLDRFETETECNEAVQAFASHPTQRVLLVLADMGTVQVSQVNHVRFQIEEHVAPLMDDGRPRAVVVVVHMPPEQVMKLPAAYQAIFLRDWQFLWVDGLGAYAAPVQALPQQPVLADGIAESPPPSPPTPSAVGELDEAMDARRWVAVAFGLKPSTPDEGIACSGEMAVLFEESLRRCIEQYISDPTELPQSPTYAPFRTLYGPRSAPAKGELLRSLFGAGGKLQGVRDELLGNFVRSWVGETVCPLVSEIAASLERAESACTFLDSIRRFMRFRMEAVLIRVLVPLLNYFGLATLRDALQGPAAPFHVELVRRVMRVLAQGALGAVAAQHGAFIHDPVSVCACARAGGALAKPARTPFFSAIAERLVALLNDALHSLRTVARTAGPLRDRLFRLLAQNPDLDAVVAQLEQDPQSDGFLGFASDFVENFIKPALVRRSNFKEAGWLALVKVFVRMAQANAPRPVVGMLMVLQLDRACLAYAVWLLSVLRPLDAPPLELLEEIRTLPELHRYLASFAVSAFHAKLDTLCAQPNADFVPLLQRFRQLRTSCNFDGSRPRARPLSDVAAPKFEELTLLFGYFLALRAPITADAVRRVRPVLRVPPAGRPGPAAGAAPASPPLLGLLEACRRIPQLWQIHAASLSQAPSAEQAERACARLIEEFCSQYLTAHQPAQLVEVDAGVPDVAGTVISAAARDCQRMNIEQFLRLVRDGAGPMPDGRKLAVLPQAAVAQLLPYLMHDALRPMALEAFNHVLGEGGAVGEADTRPRLLPLYLMDNPEATWAPLEEVVFEAFLCEGEEKSLALEVLVKRLQGAAQKNPAEVLEMAALRALLLRRLNDTMRAPDFNPAAPNLPLGTSTVVRGVLALAPATAPFYMLHGLQETRLRAILTSKDLLSVLGLDLERFFLTPVAASGAGVDHLLPFQLAGVEKVLSPVYSALVEAMRAAFPRGAAAPKDVGPVVALLQRETAAGGGGPARKGVLRMLLLAALYDEFFAVGRPWPRAAFERLFGEGGVAALLDISPTEQRCYTVWCEPPPRISDDVEALFLGTMRRESKAAALLVHVLAVVVGLTRGREHCGTRIFNAGAVHDCYTIGISTANRAPLANLPHAKHGAIGALTTAHYL